MGQHALLVEVESLDAVLGLHAAIEASRPAGVVDVVPAARTVLIVFDPAQTAEPAVRSWLARLGEVARADAPAQPSGAVIELPVRYDGDDLADTARLLGVTADDLVLRHAAATWTVAFTGFAPGFGYLVSADWPFDVPRLDAPRTRVPAGAVGLAGAFTGAYPRATPGGWRLIATTPATLFDAHAASPALLTPGATVRFREGAPSTAPPSTTPVAPQHPTRPALQVLEVGPLTTVQDLGRAGRAHLGVARSGAMDRAALRAANRLVGNAESAAGLEISLGGFRARAVCDAWIAVAGAWGPLTIGGHPIDPYTAARWPAGEELVIAPFAHGVRAVLAVRGGIAAPPALGSAATDVLAGIGPAPLRAGDVLGVDDRIAGAIPPADLVPWGAPPDDGLEIELAPGPRADWFSPASLAALFDEVWRVSPRADRVGMRLDGPTLTRTRAGELISEGMVPGAMQVPPDGAPTILLADGPVTGGYPVVAVVTDASLNALAQARPGTRIRFRHAR